MSRRLGDLVDVLASRVEPTSLGNELVDHFSIPAFDRGRNPERVSATSIRSAKFAVEDGCVLLSRLNPHIPRTWLPKLHSAIPAVCSTEFMVLRPNDQAVRGWLYFLLRSPGFTAAMNARVTGTSGSHQRVPTSSALDIPLGDLADTQSSTELELLGLLERKVRSNEQLLGLLELRSQTLLKAAPSAGQPLVLGDIAEVVRGVSYSSAELQPSPVALVSLKCFGRDGSFTSRGLKAFVGKVTERKVLRRGDVVVAQTDLTQDAAILGRSVIPPRTTGFEVLAPSLDCALVRPYECSADYLRAVLGSTAFLDHCRAHATGTTVLHLAAGAVNSFAFKLHPPTVQREITAQLKRDRQLRDQLLAENDLLEARLSLGIARVFPRDAFN